MITLIIDAANERIFLMVIKNKNIYKASYENSKTNFEKLVTLINDFLNLNGFKIEDITKLLSGDNNFPPSDFSPNTPPEHSLIYSHINNNNKIMIQKYHNYNLQEELIQSL